MEPKLSVIIPVYNSSKTLHRCVESLQNQTMTSVEIILVDDGSTDTSGDICDEVASKDERVHVIHQENKGALLARVAGCKASHGEYISFVDSDDWVDSTMYECLCAQMNNVDMLASGIYKHAFDGSVMECITNRLKEGVYDLTDINSFKGFFFTNTHIYGEDYSGIQIGVGGKIFRREIILSFIDSLKVRIREGEDWLFNVLYLLHAKSIKIVSACYYHYSSIVTSVTHTGNLNFLAEQNYIYNIVKKELSGHPAEKIVIKQIQKRMMHNIILNTGRKLEFENDVLLPEWKFPHNELLINRRVVLFGAGKIGQSYLKDWKKKKINVVHWVDNVSVEIKMFGLVSESPNVIRTAEFDYVVCGVKGELALKSIKKQLLDFGIDECKILWEKPVDAWIGYFCD